MFMIYGLIKRGGAIFSGQRPPTSLACLTEAFSHKRQIPLSLKARLPVPQILQSKQRGVMCPSWQSQGHLSREVRSGLLALGLVVKHDFKARG